MKSIPAKALLLIFLVVALKLVAGLLWTGELYNPPGIGDGPDYDNIAVSILLGKGYGTDWDEPLWRAPYEAFRDPTYYRELLSRRGTFHLTAYRPPFLPYALAVTYRWFGRDAFAAWRITNALTIALAVALIAQIAWAQFGPKGSLVVLILALCDPDLQFYTYSWLTESFSLLFIALLLRSFYVLRRGECARHTRACLVVGCILGALVLLRGVALLWIPFFLLQLLCSLRPHLRWQRVAALITLTVATTAFIVLPWVTRNISLLGTTAPFGTQGLVAVFEGYSDRVLQTRGVSPDWSAEAVRTLPHPEPELPKDVEPSIAAELRLGLAARGLGLRWIEENSELLPHLMWEKFTSLWWRDTSKFQPFLIVLALVGLIQIRREKILLETLLPSLLAVTFSGIVFYTASNGRFLIPSHVVLYLLATPPILGLIRLVSRCH